MFQKNTNQWTLENLYERTALLDALTYAGEVLRRCNTPREQWPTHSTDPTFKRERVVDAGRVPAGYVVTARQQFPDDVVVFLAIGPNGYETVWPTPSMAVEACNFHRDFQTAPL